MLGGAVFSQFFLLTLYMQEVLHYSALKTGIAYIALTLTIIVFSGVAQALVTRVGVRWVLPAGLALSTVALVLFAQLPVHGHYFSDLFPAFLISGVGLALAFVPMSIGALTGVHPADAGVASGLLNTTQQVGGAIGVAIATTVATTVHDPLPQRPRGREPTRRRRAHARLPGRLLRPRRHRRRRRDPRGGAARAEDCAKPRDHRARRPTRTRGAARSVISARHEASQGRCLYPTPQTSSRPDHTRSGRPPGYGARATALRSWSGPRNPRDIEQDAPRALRRGEDPRRPRVNTRALRASPRSSRSKSRALRP